MSQCSIKLIKSALLFKTPIAEAKCKDFLSKITKK